MNSHPDRDTVRDQQVLDRRRQGAEVVFDRVDVFFDGFKLWKLAMLVIATAAVVLMAGVCFAADGISIGGQDASGQMKDVQTLVTTMQNIGFKWVAPLIGGGLSIIGIFQIATRHLGTGLLALGGGGALFAVEKIATSLSHIAGN